MELERDFTFKFDNYDLGLIQWFTPTSRLPNSMPDIDLKAINLVRTHGAVVVSSRFTKKVIQVFGYILAPSRQAYEEAFDELKWRVSAKQRSLVIVQAGKERVYTGSVTAVSEGFIEGGKTYISLTFECNDPFGRDGSLVYYSSGDFTDSPHAFDHVFGGYADVYPKMVVTLTTVEAGVKSVSIGNSIANQMITVTREFANGDVLMVDADSQRVSVNGVVVDFTGFFPSFKPGTSYLSYADTFTARTASVDIEYPKKYL